MASPDHGHGACLPEQLIAGLSPTVCSTHPMPSHGDPEDPRIPARRRVARYQAGGHGRRTGARLRRPDRHPSGLGAQGVQARPSRQRPGRVPHRCRATQGAGPPLPVQGARPPGTAALLTPPFAALHRRPGQCENAGPVVLVRGGAAWESRGGIAWDPTASLRDFVEHYHRERPHQGLGNQLIEAAPQDMAGTGPVMCRERLGGTLKFYYREAA